MLTGNKGKFVVDQTSFFEEEKHEGKRVAVLLPVSFAGPLDYAVPEGWRMPCAGQIVMVPLSGRTVYGVVWPVKPEGRLDFKKLKPLSQLMDIPPLSDSIMKFIDWVAAYTLSPQGMVMKMVLSTPNAFESPPMKAHVVLTGEPPERMTAPRQAVLDYMQGKAPQTVKMVAQESGVSDAVVRSLVKAGTLSTINIASDKAFIAPDIDMKGPKLTGEQQSAVTAICNKVWEAEYQTFLLDGVTGSGKTEVYFEAIAEALKDDKAQVLVMVPEIALTSQWLGRFKERFGVDPIVWHSEIGQAERRRAWRAIVKGEARVIVGARSSLFLPFQKLGLIVVDEEHDASFKQEEGVMYHARDMAVVRARFEGCPLVLASATPSIETLVNAHAGRFEHLKLRERHGGAVMPTIHTIDMRSDGTANAQEWLSPILITQIEKTIAQGEQAILFLNRRGYAPLTLCRTCGHRFECPNCSAWLVEHRHKNQLQCHHCGYMAGMPDNCPECDQSDSLAACGPGVERLAEEAARLFPDARLAVMTSDTMTSPSKTAEMVAHIASGAVDLIIGTQIVTKGYHFPMLTLVGVVDADLGLRGSDMRAAERTWQQLQQVAGRAGREERPGRVFLQTYEPEHPVTASLVSGDGEAFMRAEIEQRERYHMPPYGRLVAIILTGENIKEVIDVGRALARTAPNSDGMSTYGPAPAPMERIRGKYRYRMLLHAPKDINVQKVVRAWLDLNKTPKGVRIKVDIDPQSFM